MNTSFKWLVYEPGSLEYDAAMLLQERIVAARHFQRIAHDVLMLLEHKPVFTVGRRGGRANLLVDAEMLRTRNIRLVSTLRGGDITYHGPGQLVGYLIMDMHCERMDIRRLVKNVEEVVIRAAADFGVNGHRNEKSRGVWVNGRKIASIGFAVSRGISFHGFAINANNDLTPFQWIHPCGLKDVSMTSLLEERKRPVDMVQLQTSVKKHIAGLFDASLLSVSEYALNQAIENIG